MTSTSTVLAVLATLAGGAAQSTPISMVCSWGGAPPAQPASGGSRRRRGDGSAGGIGGRQIKHHLAAVGLPARVPLTVLPCANPRICLDRE